MTIINFVTSIIGIDLEIYPELMTVAVGISGAILIILFSTIITLFGVVGGTFAPKRY